jgi:hypothetical protein
MKNVTFRFVSFFVTLQVTPDSMLQSATGPLMNSLMAENKVVCSEDVPVMSTNVSNNNSANFPPNLEPMDCNATPEMSPAHLNSSSSDAGKSSTEDVAMADNASTCSGATSITPTGSQIMQVCFNFYIYYIVCSLIFSSFGFLAIS